jgi:hypothetical protein
MATAQSAQAVVAREQGIRSLPFGTRHVHGVRWLESECLQFGRAGKHIRPQPYSILSLRQKRPDPAPTFYVGIGGDLYLGHFG